MYVNVTHSIISFCNLHVQFTCCVNMSYFDWNNLFGAKKNYYFNILDQRKSQNANKKPSKRRSNVVFLFVKISKENWSVMHFELLTICTLHINDLELRICSDG